MKILVTGASGFIGSHLVERLVREGYSVRALVRESERVGRDFFENRQDCIDVLNRLGVEIVYGDLLDCESLKRAVESVDWVFHLGAIARPMAIPDKLYFEVNEKGTENLLGVCSNEGVKRVVVMSSVSAVGPSRDGKPVNEESECRPVDVYGWSKLAQEKVVEKFVDKGLDVVVLRPPMVFGPRDIEMLRLFKAVDKRFFPLSSNVKGIEFLYVENLVEACLLGMLKSRSGEKYHVTNGEHYSINDIISGIEKGLGKRVIGVKFPKEVFVVGGWVVEIVFRMIGKHPPFRHDTVEWMSEKFWYSDSCKIERELGYVGRVGLEDGVRRTVGYYRGKGWVMEN